MYEGASVVIWLSASFSGFLLPIFVYQYSAFNGRHRILLLILITNDLRYPLIDSLMRCLHAPEYGDSKVRSIRMML